MRSASLHALVIAAVLAGGCLPPGASTVVDKGVAEARGGRGGVQEVQPLAQGLVLDRYHSVRVLPVERSPDSGPIPSTLPGVLHTSLVNGVRETKLFPGESAPTLLLRVRLTTHWPDAGIAQILSAYSEILALVEFREERHTAPVGVYYVRGFSTAIKRKSDDDLSAGLTASVVEIIKQHHSPPHR